MQELLTINVKLQLITEDNIQHFENMCYSDNILKLDVNKTDGTRIDESFNIVAENDVRRQAFLGTWKAYGGTEYDTYNSFGFK